MGRCWWALVCTGGYWCVLVVGIDGCQGQGGVRGATPPSSSSIAQHQGKDGASHYQDHPGAHPHLGAQVSPPWLKQPLKSSQTWENTPKKKNPSLSQPSPAPHFPVPPGALSQFGFILEQKSRQKTKGGPPLPETRSPCLSPDRFPARAQPIPPRLCDAFRATSLVFIFPGEVFLELVAPSQILSHPEAPLPTLSHGSPLFRGIPFESQLSFLAGEIWGELVMFSWSPERQNCCCCCCAAGSSALFGPWLSWWHSLGCFGHVAKRGRGGWVGGCMDG